MAKRRSVQNLYYITHIENLPSILQRGILSHAEVEHQKIHPVSVYDHKIVADRKERTAPDGRSLWDFANLYVQPRNPMLYRVTREQGSQNIAVLAVKSQVLEIAAFVSLGNAASPLSEIVPVEEGIRLLTAKEMWDILQSEWWNQVDGSKRKIMAECLVPHRVPAELIHTIYVANHQTAERVRSMLGPARGHIEVVQEPHFFFQPRRSGRVTPTLTWVDGDMFFSHMQTLTISVNTVGIMGKGLASRAKYQFPDVYVRYQEVCRSKVLEMGKPYLYKRESSLDDELADEPFSSGNNGNEWFLLFPTKRHWRERSEIQGIEQGLRWIRERYKTEDIQSLAIPALGCGLGGLDWREVGPLMCRYLADLDIQVAIYLPQEKPVAEEHLKPEFLLGLGG